jgi:hypothetical protein
MYCSSVLTWSNADDCLGTRSNLCSTGVLNDTDHESSSSGTCGKFKSTEYKIHSRKYNSSMKGLRGMKVFLNSTPRRTWHTYFKSELAFTVLYLIGHAKMLYLSLLRKSKRPEEGDCSQ